jgi:hypothetical protein
MAQDGDWLLDQDQTTVRLKLRLIKASGIPFAHYCREGEAMSEASRRAVFRSVIAAPIVTGTIIQAGIGR